ncbi:MAG: MFS transporter, partial [Hydrogenophilaceae bacterium]|nr:MFS transporter [Hydrogenophilaceae bacterium]
MSTMSHDYRYGIQANLAQFSHQLFQVFLVGLTLGTLRTVVPALAETEFGVPKGSFMLLMTFVVAFGFVKGTLNFVAGRLSERMGRKTVLLLGWASALPIPLMILYAPSWGWIVAATVLLGVNQGFTWSMTQTAKLDLTRPDQRGLTIGLNEFSGYVGVAIAGIATGYMANAFGPREGLMIFGSTVVVVALLLTALWVKETLGHAKAEGARHAAGKSTGPVPRYPTNIADTPSTWEVFTLMSWRDKRMFAISQAGLVEKFVDALIWVFYPVFLYQQGLNLAAIGWVVGVYGFVWGGSQFFTGKLSDHIGRQKPIVWGMWLCGGGVAAMPLLDSTTGLALAGALSGFGMALLYPNLSAAVADIA